MLGFLVGLIADSSHVVEHVFELYMVFLTDLMRTEDYDKQRVKQMRERGKDPVLWVVEVFQKIYKESQFTLPGEFYSNPYFNFNLFGPVHVPSKVYFFYNLLQSSNLSLEFAQQENNVFTDSIMYIRRPDRAVTKRLFSTINRISQHQPVTDLWMGEVSCEEELEPDQQPIFSEKARSIGICHCKLPMSFFKNLLRQLSGSVTLQFLDISGCNLKEIEEDLDEFMKSLLVTHPKMESENAAYLAPARKMINFDNNQLSQTFKRKWLASFRRTIIQLSVNDEENRGNMGGFQIKDIPEYLTAEDIIRIIEEFKRRLSSTGGEVQEIDESALDLWRSMIEDIIDIKREREISVKESIWLLQEKENKNKKAEHQPPDKALKKIKTEDQPPDELLKRKNAEDQPVDGSLKGKKTKDQPPDETLKRLKAEDQYPDETLKEKKTEDQPTDGMQKLNNTKSQPTDRTLKEKKIENQPEEKKSEGQIIDGTLEEKKTKDKLKEGSLMKTVDDDENRRNAKWIQIKETPEDFTEEKINWQIQEQVNQKASSCDQSPSSKIEYASEDQMRFSSPGGKIQSTEKTDELNESSLAVLCSIIKKLNDTGSNEELSLWEINWLIQEEENKNKKAEDLLPDEILKKKKNEDRDEVLRGKKTEDKPPDETLKETKTEDKPPDENLKEEKIEDKPLEEILKEKKTEDEPLEELLKEIKTEDQPPVETLKEKKTEDPPPDETLKETKTEDKPPDENLKGEKTEDKFLEELLKERRQKMSLWRNF